jgi:hypothetical protein
MLQHTTNFFLSNLLAVSPSPESEHSTDHGYSRTPALISSAPYVDRMRTWKLAQPPDDAKKVIRRHTVYLIYLPSALRANKSWFSSCPHSPPSNTHNTNELDHNRLYASRRLERGQSSFPFGS